MRTHNFLPTATADLADRNWHYYDYLIITGDAYIDHPSFGAAVIGRVLEAEGHRVAVLAQPNWHDTAAFLAMGRPRFGIFVTAGNLDSMVAHYTAAQKPRREDYYSPGGKAGLRPDRAAIVYANRAREAFPSLPVILGGLEASLRRFAHYDYWSDKVRRSILFDAKADLIVYGMGESATREIAARLKNGEPVSELCDIRGTAYAVRANPVGVDAHIDPHPIECPAYESVQSDKHAYATTTRIQAEEHDPIRGRAVLQAHGDRVLVVNPPAMPLDGKDLDAVYDLPYTRAVHPMYEAQGGVPAIEEVRFSVIHNRGCFGGCNFCALSFHQGRMVSARTHQSVVREVESFIGHPDFKGYVHDIGGPTANFRRPSCAGQKERGLCKHKQCLAPKPCAELDADHTDYLKLLRKVRELPGVKKAFVRSGIRFDYLLEDTNGECFAELVHYHISGQLKVAPEHVVPHVLDCMGKPHADVYDRFAEKYRRLNQKYDKDQYLVPYLMSNHPGSTLQDAVKLAEALHKQGKHPEQVQDFYPTPGTISTAMYHTGLDPMTMQPVHVPKDGRERTLQRALLQWRRPEKKKQVLEALRKAGREDLIGFHKWCLVKPDGGAKKRKP
ncbi:MAG: YgiQ family radical SAM protein [Oscillospiraceae bacterium]|nr:YgiQ family radical SAM protein [Oscillospiraceae bacterium]